MKSRLLVVALLAAGSAVFGCSDDSQSGNGGASPSDGGSLDSSASGGNGGSGSVDSSTPSVPQTMRAACRAYITAACERIAECHDDPGRLQSCLDLSEQCPDYLFSDGSTRTVQSALACAEAWKTLPCADAATGQSPSCATPGTRQQGESCLFVSQCASLGCTGTSGTVCGTCLGLAALGEPCDDITVGCALGQECTSGTCQEVQWTPPEMPDAQAGDAQVPGPSGPGEDCRGYLGCVEGYECLRDPDDDSILTCRRLPEPGEMCAVNTGFTRVCAPGAYCPPPSANTCVAEPVAGEPCRFNGSVWDCADNHACVRSDGGLERTCIAVREEGEACDDTILTCTPGTECQSGRCTATDELTLFDSVCSG